MPNKRASKAQGVNEIAAAILVEAVGEPAPITPGGKKNPAAVDSSGAGEIRRAAAKAKSLPPKKRKA